MVIGVTDIMIILDTYMVGAIALIIVWWIVTFLSNLMTGCGGLDLKKYILTGFAGTGCILGILGCIQYFMIFISSM